MTNLDDKTLDELEKKAYRTGNPEDDFGMDVWWRERFLDLISSLRESREEVKVLRKVLEKYRSKQINENTWLKDPEVEAALNWKPSEDES